MLECLAKGSPCRIGSPPCRVGPPTRRGSSFPRVQIPQKEGKTSAPCRVGAPIRRGSTPKAPNPSKREQKKRATSHWEPAMSHWASNTTWHEPKGAEPPQKEVKRARHVALVARHVALGLQRDVAPPQGSESPQKGAKRARHVVLCPRHVVLGLQHDVVPPQRHQITQKGSKTSAPRRIGSAPCRVGPPTRRGSHMLDSIILRQALINGGVVILVASVVAFVEWVEIFS